MALLLQSYVKPGWQDNIIRHKAGQCYMERKDFIKKTFALCGLSLIPAALIESCSKQSFAGPSNVNFTLDLTSASNAPLNTVGGSLVVNGVIVIRASSSVYDALSATCT